MLSSRGFVFLTGFLLIYSPGAVIQVEGRGLWEDIYEMVKDVTGGLIRGGVEVAKFAGRGVSYTLDKLDDFRCEVKGRNCCRRPYLTREREDLERFKSTLEAEFFGQHLAMKTVLRALDGHISDPDPAKALFLSLHGWPGSGKTYLAQHLMRAFFQDGTKSPLAKFYMASLHFPDNSVGEVRKYQEDLRKDIEYTISLCDKAVFVFDEIDKTPPGVLDALVPYIDYPGHLDGQSYNKAVFIFLSNTGANEITTITLNAFREGRRREELSLKDFEGAISKGAFNENNFWVSDAEGGLYKSRMIDKALISYYIPFLPMERRHVLQCIFAEAERHGGEDKVEPEQIADMLTYWPPDLQLYSQTGCKRVDVLVKYELSDIMMKDEL